MKKILKIYSSGLILSFSFLKILLSSEECRFENFQKTHTKYSELTLHMLKPKLPIILRKPVSSKATMKPTKAESLGDTSKANIMKQTKAESPDDTSKAESLGDTSKKFTKEPLSPKANIIKQNTLTAAESLGNASKKFIEEFHNNDLFNLFASLSDDEKQKIIRSSQKVHSFYAETLFCKTNSRFERVINAQRMCTVIKKYNLNLLSVADKGLVFHKDRWITLCKGISYDDNFKLIDTNMLNQLIILVEKTGYSDWQILGTNWKKEKNKALVCIDTENQSFGNNNSRVIELLQAYENGTSIFFKETEENKEKRKSNPIQAVEKFKNNYVLSLSTFVRNMTEDAKNVFHAYCNSIETKPKCEIILPNNTEYDSREIDFKKVQEETEYID